MSEHIYQGRTQYSEKLNAKTGGWLGTISLVLMSDVEN
jgi:hypothetical protein